MFGRTKEIPASHEQICLALSSFSVPFYLLIPQALQTAFPSHVGRGLWERKEMGPGLRKAKHKKDEEHSCNALGSGSW